jgi:N-glycosylase/DNA lyase
LFCLLTPAARAHSAWDALQNLKTKGLILSTETAVSTPSVKDSGFRSLRIADELRIVRFKNNKARNVMEAEQYFTCEGSVSVRSRLSCFQSTLELREWLAATIRGMGYKEASHFLRNIGRGDDIAILDRHILRCLKRLGIIDTVPEGLTEKRYIHTEQRMRNLALRLGMPLSHLDILFWYHETGEIFK